MNEKRNFMEKTTIEFNFIGLLKIIWFGKKEIITSIIVCAIIGVVISFSTQIEYTSKTTILPQSGGQSSANLNQLASMTGFSLLGGIGSEESIPVNLYPKIVQSIPFLKEISNTYLKFNDFENRITLRNYYKEYFGSNSFKKTPSSSYNNLNSDFDEVLAISSSDMELYDLISSKISVELNSRTNTVTISANMPEARASAELAKKVTAVLQKYITDFKTQKALDELTFLELRYSEVEKEFIEKQYALAEFQDSNLNLKTSIASARLTRLESDFNLISNVFLQLSQQLETQKLKVKKETPIFTIIEPVSVPLIRSKPIRSKIVKIWLLIGFTLGVLISIFKQIIPYYKKKFNNKV